MSENQIRKEIEEKYILFQQNITLFQSNLRKIPTYIKFEAFKDLKIIFELYSEIFHLRGFNYGKLSTEKINILLSHFDGKQKIELINHLVKSLIKNGNEDEALKIMKISTKVEICFYWKSIKSLEKGIFLNSIKLLHKICSYNLFALSIVLALYLVISTLIYSNAFIDDFAVLSTTKIKISNTEWLNNLGNVLLLIFDFDKKMEVIPLNFWGVVLMVSLKLLLILVVVNYLIKEFLEKIKLR